MMLRGRHVRTLLAALKPDTLGDCQEGDDESEVRKHRRRSVSHKFSPATRQKNLVVASLFLIVFVARCFICSSVSHNGRRITFLDGPPKWQLTINRSESTTTNTLLEKREILEEPSDDYIPDKEPCPYIADWQRTTSPYPTCNSVHEVGSVYSWIAAGAFKDVWQVDEQVILKSSVWNFEFSSFNLARHQKDALVMDETTASPYVLNIYAYCAFSSLVESARMTLKQWLHSVQERPSSATLLHMAAHMAQALADVHLYQNGLPTFVHADLKASQYLVLSTPVDRTIPIVKLNDFNRGRLLTAQNQTLCPFVVHARHRGSTNRSPEEYQNEAPLSDKIDVFAFGSTLYEMVTGGSPFDNLTYEDGKRKILNGIQPPLPNLTTDPSLMVLIRVLQQCRQYGPEDRPNSRQVAMLLSNALTL